MKSQKEGGGAHWEELLQSVSDFIFSKDCGSRSRGRVVQIMYCPLKLGTKFSDYLGLKHYKKTKKIKHFIHLGLAQQPQSFSLYHTISP